MKSIALTLAVLLGMFGVVANATSQKDEPKKDIIEAAEIVEEGSEEPRDQKDQKDETKN